LKMVCTVCKLSNSNFFSQSSTWLTE
jgi:hypothetical protein